MLLFLDMKLDDLSIKAAESVMAYPHKLKEFCEIVRKISRFICVDILNHLEWEHIGDTDFDDHNVFDEAPEITVLSDTESDYD